MFSRLAFSAAAALIAYAPAPTQAQPSPAPVTAAAPIPFKAVTYDALGFNALFPGEPQRLDMDVPIGKDSKTGVDRGKMHMSMFLATQVPGLVFMVMRMDVSQAPLDSTGFDKAFDELSGKMTAQLGAKSLTATGGPGHEMTFQRDNKFGRMRFFASGKVLYIMMVMAAAEVNVKTPDCDRFLEGIALKPAA